jgi:DNA-binding transcriptional regulator YdaS (Cro superfamily)
MNAYDLEQVTQYFGNKTELAKALSIAPQAVYQWKTVPPRRALEIEKLTHGLFKAESITPLEDAA